MPHQSPFAPIEIPDVDLWTLLFERKSRPFTDSKEIFTDGDTGRSYTFGELRAAALDFGRGLQALWDWQKGDVLGLYTPNSVDTPAVTMGTLWAGGAISPANPLYTLKELAFQMKNSGAKALATQLPFLETARAAAREAGIPEDRVLLIGDQHDPEGRVRHFTEVRGGGAVPVKTAAVADKNKDKKKKKHARPAIDPPRDHAFLVYSSGTTGLPKGVCLSHRNVVSNLLQAAEVDGRYFHPHGGVDGRGDKFLGVSPFFHIYGLTIGVFQCMYQGWEMVVMPRFDLEKACALIEQHGITTAYVPPPIILALAKHPVVEKYDLASLRMLSSGAAPLTRELTEALWDRLKVPVKQGYGLSETAPATHVQLPEEWGKFMGSVGKLLPNMEAKIVDLDGNEVAEGEEGELWVRGPNVFLGYLGQPENTAACTSPCGYFKTGDIFRRDKWGNYYCVDRLKELIKYKGFQVPPAELEGLLLGHEDVLDVGVVGVHDPSQATELPRAYIVLRPGTARDNLEAKAAELAAWAAAQTAPHKKLRGGVRFVDEIPKSQSGKILRRVLRERAKEDARREGVKL